MIGVPEPSKPVREAERPLVERVVADRSLRSGYWSLVAHLGVGILLAMVAWDSRTPAKRSRPILIDSRPGSGAAGGERAGESAVAALVGLSDDAATAADDAARERPVAKERATVAGSPVPPSAADRAASPSAETDVPEPAVGASDASTLEPAGPTARRSSAPVAATGGGSGAAGGRVRGGFEARRAAARGEAVRARGGSTQSEAAVERGLAWLAAHQAADGSWRCDLSGCRCDGACRDPGSIGSTTASTAIALLPFLGAGNTHEDGPYREAVSRGIYYLTSRLKQTPRGADLTEGTMYGHGLATLVFTEAFGMTRDDFLKGLAIDSIRFIETSQDQYTGGWRYLPGQPGDITVTAWQVAALKSGEIAGLTIPSPTVGGAVRFLDRVQSMEGAAYGYRSPSAKPSTSSIGLLCRMYTGWKPGHEPLDRGIARLVTKPPDPHDLYMNFYLSQLLVQSSHRGWPAWNARLRDGLVRLQAKVGHESGSWFLEDRETAAGGRLAHTALAVLTLEVYYRLLPLYGEQAVAGSF